MQPEQQPLAVDIGNSGLRLSLLNVERSSVGEPLRIDWSHGEGHRTEGPGVGRRFAPDSDEWLAAVEGWLKAHTTRPALWMISSVRGDARDRLVDFTATRAGDNCRVVTYGDVPMELEVDYPERLGIDRLLAAFAAAATTASRPFVVIQAGSAVTVDLVTRRNSGDVPPSMVVDKDSFAGGAILPGVPMMLRLLGRGADMLPEIDADDLIDLPPLPGRNTEAAMMCGTSSALVGGVMHLVTRYRSLYGNSLPVVVSGGDGMRLSPFIAAPVRMEDHLVQRGLLRLLNGSPVVDFVKNPLPRGGFC